MGLLAVKLAQQTRKVNWYLSSKTKHNFFSIGYSEIELIKKTLATYKIDSGFISNSLFLNDILEKNSSNLKLQKKIINGEKLFLILKNLAISSGVNVLQSDFYPPIAKSSEDRVVIDCTAQELSSWVNAKLGAKNNYVKVFKQQFNWIDLRLLNEGLNFCRDSFGPNVFGLFARVRKDIGFLQLFANSEASFDNVVEELSNLKSNINNWSATSIMNSGCRAEITEVFVGKADWKLPEAFCLPSIYNGFHPLGLEVNGYSLSYFSLLWEGLNNCSNSINWQDHAKEFNDIVCKKSDRDYLLHKLKLKFIYGSLTGKFNERLLNRNNINQIVQNINSI